MATADLTRLGPPPGARIAVFGGAGGIGRAAVAGCLKTSLETYVLDLPGTAPPPGCTFIPVDATSESSVRDAVAKLPDRLDAVINLIGGGNGVETATSIDTERFAAVMNRNLTSAFLISKHVMARLKASGAGSLIHTASGAGFRPIPGTADYGAAKAGLVALTRSLAAENGPTVRVNVVAPGGVTNRIALVDGKANDSAGIDVESIRRQIPLGRFADPEDLVGPILFLAGPASGYITGQTLHLNGGLWMA